MADYNSLNKEQLEAVLHTNGPLLILAGAGSGKTRVLTHRIAHLIENEGVNPYEILAITFTNKAAREMRERVDRLVSFDSDSIWVSTFHSTCVRMLRRYIEQLGYSRNFTIYDTDDQKTLMREVCKYLSIDTKNIKERSALSAISSAKDKLISPEEFERNAGGDFLQRNYAKIYFEYQKRLKENNALDFDDIICKTVELFQTSKEALSFYQRRFRYIMVDEYQDTNAAQFMLIKLLASHTNDYGECEHNLCVVGDDDQSIYKFRGADIRNILDFELEYPDAKVIKLEQNYRSTKNILDTANAVIKNNLGRKDKSLWTDNGDGSAVNYYRFNTDLDEASFVAGDVLDTIRSVGCSYNDFAVLYRTNAQARVLEEQFIRKSIPYKVIGSINFYQRKEIKDILAYLKTIENGTDSLSIKRVINVPKRGIGLATLDKIEAYAQEHEISFYNAMRAAAGIPSITSRISEKINSFVAIIEAMRKNLLLPDYSVKQLITDLLEATGYTDYLNETDEEDAEDRIANVDELISKAADFDSTRSEPGTLGDFLEEIALVADIDNLDENAEAVVLMTIHSAKGLEFPYLYLCGMEEGIFPSYMSINSDNPEMEIEEERRLCYVGITRAKKLLTLSSASQRMIRGEVQYNRPSRFINEIPRHLISVKGVVTKSYLNGEAPGKALTKEQKPPLSFEKPSPSPLPAARNFGSASLVTLSYGVGDTVTHIKFGQGTVTEITKGGRDYEVTVNFPSVGVRKLLASFANLKKV